MNSLMIYRDELQGFLKSKVFVILVVGLPVLVTGLRLAQPDLEGMSFFIFTAILIASISGTLGSVLLSTAITSERSRHVYELFLIRPVPRASLLLGKYFAALSALLITVVVTLGVGLATDALAGRAGPGIVSAGLEPAVLSLAGIAVACSVGTLLGVIVDSIAVSAILSVYLGNQLSALAILPSALAPDLPVVAIAVAAGIIVPTALLAIAVRVFARKTL